MVAEISWSHNVVIMEKCKDDLEQEFYIQMSNSIGIRLYTLTETLPKEYKVILPSLKEIEKLLDILLDYQFMGVGEKEFNQLNKYYGTFDKDAKLEWEKIQKDLLKR